MASGIAEAMDTSTGSIFGVVKRMVGDGLVNADTGAPTRGTRYSLTPAGRVALETTERAAIVPGKLNGKEQLLLVDQPSRMTAVQEVLAEEWIAGCVTWAAEVGGGWLLAVSGDTSFPTQRLTMALERAGAEPRTLVVNDVFSGEELHDRAVWLLEDVEQSV